ncbi:hypothetical protein [Luteibacter sp.]|uniref:hypothetical protein n=1 Tax=Luteibacter sp. TaxID=1886636 RepID=UPI003F7F52D1
MSVNFDLPYFPRDGLLQEVLRVFESGLKQGVTLFAPRRQGKTSFVKHELLPAAHEFGWRSYYVDLWKRRGEPELALVEALEAFANHRGLRQRLRLKEVKSKAKAPGAEIEATLEPGGHRPDDSLENRLDAALSALVKDGVTLLVLDEVQSLAGAKREDFVAALRTVLQKFQGKLLVFYTGSSREQLNAMFRKQRAPLFASTMAVQLPELHDDFVDDRLAFLAQRSVATVSKREFVQAFDDLGRTPGFFNELVLHLIIAGDGDLGKAMNAWRKAHVEAGAGAQLESLRPMEMAVMQLLAMRDHPSVYSADAAEFIKRSIDDAESVTPAKIQTAIKKLMRLDLVAPTGKVAGDYEIDDRAILIQLREGLL